MLKIFFKIIVINFKIKTKIIISITFKGLLNYRNNLYLGKFTHSFLKQKKNIFLVKIS